MDHDRIFKELLRTFFFEFLELFFPTLLARVDRSHEPVFLDKEDFGELPADLRREMDLVARLRLRDGEAYFVVHVEHEAQSNAELPSRMFRYFSRLWDRHGLPVYPIAVLSFAGRKVWPRRYTLDFHDLRVLEFRYRTVQLNQLDWRSFLDRPNPVATALMARMKIRKADRPRVKLQCLRLLVTLRLDRRRSGLIAHFVHSYLRLNQDEVRIYRQGLELISMGERQEIMQYTNDWIEQGVERGLEQGLERGLKQGIERGLEIGRAEGLRQGLSMFLKLQYVERAQELLQRLPSLDAAALESLQRQLESRVELDELEIPREP